VNEHLPLPSQSQSPNRDNDDAIDIGENGIQRQST
jgi:hypothetical protein